MWGMIIGAFLAVSAKSLADSDPSLAFANIFLPYGYWLVVLALFVVVGGVIIINALNLYGASLSSITIVSSFDGAQNYMLRHGRTTRLLLGIIIAVVSTVIAIFGEQNIMPFINNLLLILMYIFIPWSAINLTDFYFVRRGKYAVEDMYNKNGRYGAYGFPALITLFITIFSEIPFMSTPFFTGFIAHALNGSDITWIVGLIVGTTLYPILMRQNILGQRTV